MLAIFSGFDSGGFLAFNAMVYPIKMCSSTKLIIMSPLAKLRRMDEGKRFSRAIIVMHI